MSWALQLYEARHPNDATPSRAWRRRLSPFIENIAAAAGTTKQQNSQVLRFDWSALLLSPRGTRRGMRG